MRICVAGLGAMGSSLARRLVSKGFSVVLYNRTVEKAKKLAEELGVEFVDTPSRCAEQCDVVTIFVSDDEAVLNVVLPPNGLVSTDLSGKIVVNMSTITVNTSLMVKKLVESAHGRYVEAPVLGSVSEVLEGQLLTIVAGDREAVDRLEPMLKAISRRIVYVGEVPRAMILKLAVNQLNHYIAAGFAETLAFVELYGIELDTLKSILEDTWMKCVVKKFWHRMVEGMKSVRFRLELAAKDLQCFVESARRLGLETIATAGAVQRFLEAVSAGWRDHDYTQIGRYLVEKSKRVREERRL